MIYINIEEIKKELGTSKVVAYIKLVVLSCLMIALLASFYLTILWGNNNRIIWQTVVRQPLELQSPLLIEPIKTVIVQPVEYIGASELTKLVQESPNVPIAEYICKVFGPVDCPTALAVAKAESGMRVDAYNFNTNNTLDYGIFQINSVHWAKDGCSMKDIVDPYKNVDCAKRIRDASGWEAWAVVQNGSYLTKLGK